ncbi:catabolic L-serine/threonine dehydratase [Taxawa tesnikishii (nom. ined.)]|nr:catabolic L-serine/threonine dehydratase [Dothideales sp. JES 119]
MGKQQQKPWVETPLVESSTLSKAAGCRIFLKLENLQPSGSFKSRGVGHYMSTLLKSSSNPSAVHFYSSSGGNAGLACVHAARFLGRPATVVVPMSTKPLMLAKIRAAGANEVLQHGASWKDADTWMRETVVAEAKERGEEPLYVPPFDHELIWEGNAVLVEEVKRQMEGMCGEDARPDIIVCSVGGGGLFNGIVQGAETSVLAGENVTLPEITSQATSLGATKVSERTYELATTRKQVKSIVLSDPEAAMGSWRLADDERLLVELACGVNVALCYGGRLEKALERSVRKDEKVVIVVCGGSNITIDNVTEWKYMYRTLNDGVSGAEEKVVASAASINGTE